MYDAISILRFPIGWCLDGLTTLFNGVPFLVTVGSYGLAIICTTLIIRALLFPLFGWQLKTQRRTQKEQRLVAPELAELRKKYRKDPKKLQEEMQKVYGQHGIHPLSGLAGCLPVLVQAPVLIGLYAGIRTGTSHLTQQEKGFLWIPDVSKSVHDLCCPTFHGTGGFAEVLTWIGETFVGMIAHPTLAIIPLVAAGATFIQSRMMMPPLRDDMTPQERSMAGMTKNLSYLAPVSVLLFSLNFAQGLPLYWATSTCFMLLQQFYVVGWGSLSVPPWVPGHGRVTALSYPTGPAPSSKAMISATTGNGKGPSGSNGRGPDGRRPPRAERERVPTEPVAPGTGRTPARNSSTKKRRRR